MKTININGKDFTLEELSKLVESAKKENPMDKIFRFHSTTEEEFNNNHSKVSDFTKAIAIEEMIVNFYNKGVIVDFDNYNQKKYYAWFYLGKNFRLYLCYSYRSYSSVPARLCFLREEDLREATEIYLEQYRNSRNK